MNLYENLLISNNIIKQKELKIKHLKNNKKNYDNLVTFSHSYRRSCMKMLMLKSLGCSSCGHR
jgi:hypothetical protein